MGTNTWNSIRDMGSYHRTASGMDLSTRIGWLGNLDTGNYLGTKCQTYLHPIWG
jgi:hypothetical protein